MMKVVLLDVEAVRGASFVAWDVRGATFRGATCGSPNSVQLSATYSFNFIHSITETLNVTIAESFALGAGSSIIKMGSAAPPRR
jgi:hypothetical protein